MEIIAVDLFAANIPLRQPFRISQGSISVAANVFVRVRCGNGLIGWGEACPFPHLVGETQATVLSVGELLRPVLLGRDPRAIGRLVADMDGVIKGNATCKSAFDMALYDLAARAAGVPLYRYLGGSNDRQIVSDNTVSLDTTERMVHAAKRYVADGIRILKVKLGGSPGEDVARIAAIRRAVGERIAIRVDANQGWSVPDAIACLRALEPYDIQHCEAPISRRLAFRLSAIRRATRIPLMADEALFDPHDAACLAKSGAVDYFNIKLCKAGGIYRALQILAVAAAYGIPCQVGGMSESRLGTAAAAHFALASPLVRYYDLDMPLGHASDPTAGEGVRVALDGSVTVGEEAGIGVRFAGANGSIYSNFRRPMT